MPITDPAAIKAIRDLMQWHQEQVDYLKQVHNAGDHPVVLDFGDGTELALNNEQSRGFRAGLMMALDFLGELPVVLSPEDSREVH